MIIMCMLSYRKITRTPLKKSRVGQRAVMYTCRPSTLGELQK